MTNSIEYNYWNFNRIEEKISEFLCELGSEFLICYVKSFDIKLHAQQMIILTQN